MKLPNAETKVSNINTRLSLLNGLSIRQHNKIRMIRIKDVFSLSSFALIYNLRVERKYAYHPHNPNLESEVSIHEGIFS
jgi:hypothetical protein